MQTHFKTNSSENKIHYNRFEFSLYVSPFETIVHFFCFCICMSSQIFWDRSSAKIFLNWSSVDQNIRLVIYCINMINKKFDWRGKINIHLIICEVYFVNVYTYTHAHTHTGIYIYIYIYIYVYIYMYIYIYIL